MKSPPLILILLILPSLMAVFDGSASAESRRSPSRTGFDVALHGSGVAIAGRPLLLRGSAFEVVGLDELRALPGARVMARYATGAADLPDTAWQQVTSDPQGRFQIAVHIPDDARGSSRVELRVDSGDEQQQREIQIPITLHAPSLLTVRTDRVLYEPGETVHLWVLARDIETLAPVDGTTLRVTVTSGDEVEVSRRAATDESGVAAVNFQLPETAESGWRRLRVEVDGGVVPARTQARFTVGRRRIDRMLTSIEVSPEVVPPGGAMRLTIEVRSPSGSPLRNARVELEVEGGRRLEGETDSQGRLALETQAPAFASISSGHVSLTGRVTHPGYGSLELVDRFQLALPLSLQVDVVPFHGGLVPEIDDQMILTVLDTAGEPPPEGTEVEVRGAVVADRTGLFRGRTDRNGLVLVPTRLPRSAVTTHPDGRGDPCGGQPATTFEVIIRGEAPRVARLCVPVRVNAQVAPTLARPLIHTGEPIEVTVSRRPDARGMAVALDLMIGIDEDDRIVRSIVVEPGVDRAALEPPPGRVGLLRVRARPLGGEGSSQDAGAFDAVIIQPRNPTFPRIDADREVYSVRGRARLTVHTDPYEGPAFLALVARDLSAHAGERPFEYHFLGEALDHALLEPDQGDSELLIRAALASRIEADPLPIVSPDLIDALNLPISERYDPQAAAARGDLRDPVALGLELRRRGVGPVMAALELALATALSDGDMERLTLGSGRDRRFRPDAVALARRWDELPRTLGGAPMTVEHLEGADPSFDFEAVARRVARQRLVRLLHLLSMLSSFQREDVQSDPLRRVARMMRREPPDRWLAVLLQEGVLRTEDLSDTWGGAFTIQRSTLPTVLIMSEGAVDWELLSPGPDGIAGNGDDLRDPFLRVVDHGTPYAVASGEDRLMEELSLVAPGMQALEAMLGAYGQLGPEAEAEELGDAASAGRSEDVSGLIAQGYDGTIGLGNLTTIGHGGGGGSGSGYGRGAGGLGRRQARRPGPQAALPPVLQGGGRGVLSALMRERFPATLSFIARQPVDPSGQTMIDLPLAHAATTYRVEVVIWRGDGWIWSAARDIRVDQDLVVDAPVPPVITLGDQIRLPLWVANRLPDARSVKLRATVTEALGADDMETGSLTVPPSQTIDSPVLLAPRRAGEGVLTLSGWSGDDQPLDAMQRPIRVIEDGRRVRLTGERVIEGSGVLELVVPSEATPWGAGEVTIRVGPGLFEGLLDERPLWRAWAEGVLGREIETPLIDEALDRLPEEGEQDETVEGALALGATWDRPSASDERLRGVILGLTEHLSSRRIYSTIEDNTSMEDAWEVTARLLALAPAIRRVAARPSLRQELLDLVRMMRDEVETWSVRISEAPWLWAHAAAALSWTSPTDEVSSRVQELLRRARRSLIEVGDDLWLEGGASEDEDRLYQASALLALAEIRGGDRTSALALARTLARVARRAEPAAGSIDTDPEVWGPALAAVQTLSAGARLDSATLVIDGHEQRIELSNGLGRVVSADLSRPGEHRIELRGAAGVVAILSARVEHGLPWDSSRSGSGPFILTLTGDPAARDEVSELRLEVRNRSPRRISEPIVEVYLPAGAELEASALEQIQRESGHAPEMDGQILRIRLGRMPPGLVRVLTLRLRWSLGGRMRGLGVAAWADDRPRVVSVIPSRELVIEEPVDRTGGGR